jgi:hypothetical protein
MSEPWIYPSRTARTKQEHNRKKFSRKAVENPYCVRAHLWQEPPDTEETNMNKLIGGLALLFLIGGTGTGANAAPWCAFYDPSTYNCGFHSYQQCLETIRGAGGWCRPNPFEGGGQVRRRRD